MSFASFTEDPQLSSAPTEPTGEVIQQDWWPDVSLDSAREIVRISGTVSEARLRDALQAAAYSINHELGPWRLEQQGDHPEKLSDERLAFLYLRAVHFHAKAELIDRYRDYDSTADGDRRGDAMSEAAEDARRTVRWSISELLGIPRLTVELM